MLKNLKENFGKGFSKKKIVSIAIFAIAVIATIIAIVVNQTSEQSSRRKKIVAEGELARAMTYDQFVDGDEAVDGTDNVKFSAFFLRDIDSDGYAEKIKGTCKQIGKEDTLYMEVNVQTDGILKNAKIEIDGKNFYLATTAPKDNELKDNYIGTNIKTLEFNDMANGTQKLITGIVRSGDYSYSSSRASAIGSNINNLSRNDNKIIFTGTYVDADGNEIEISKEVNLQMDWYGTTSASISTSTSTYYDIQDRQNEEDGTLTLEAGIRAYENNNQLNIKKNYVEGTIPQLNGFDPISVTMQSSTNSFSYDEVTRKFTVTREATVDENGNITKSVSKDNYYTLKIVYPLEAYKSLDSTVVTIQIPVMTYYEGYNNKNSEFTNPYKSNEAKGTLTYTFRGPQEQATSVSVKVGQYISNPTGRYVVSKKKPLKIYNEISSEEKDDNYIVSWYIAKGTNESSDGLIMKERKAGENIVADSFVKADSTTDSMENITTNIGIGFDNADKFLAEDGFIKVYDDETDELLVTFTSNDWGKYTKASPYRFSMPVKHIRVETSETQSSQYFYVYSQKQLDDEYITTNYTREQFDNLKYIKSNLNVYAGEKLLGTVTHSANYEAPFSIASLSVSNNTLSTQLTEKNEILTIKATANESANQVGWTNGSFLIKLPTDIITADINNVEINNFNISLTSYEYIENDNGRFIKVNTQNTSSTAQTFEIKLDTNITPDPRIATTTENFELWASNEEGADYYYGTADIYDVNDNLNTAEMVHKSTATISLIAPNSLLTNQTASGFDKSGAQVVSPQIADVKPQLATVSQDTPEKTVRIGAQIKNNYSSVITDVVMLGKIPFEGNTYVLSGEDLGSEFTTKMTEAGIEVPEALKDKVVVYYSENEIPDKDLTKESNGWKTAENITNWDNVKTFLIDFKDTEVASGAEYTFYYTIKVPNGLDYNKKSFSHHGVYFALKTSEGKYRTQTEPNKLGLRIAEKYNLELQKYQTGKTNLVPGATYKITKEATDTEDEESKTAVTNAEGKLELQNLYAKRTYSIEEIKTPEDYELNTDVIKIIGTIQEDGSLQVEKTQGTTKEDIEITKDGEDHPYKVTIKVEDEAKAKLKITKLEKDTTTPVRGIRYKLTGTGLPENGKNVTTNTNGEITVKGLKIGEEYTLEETKAEGYYLASPIKFTVINTDGTYEINVSEGTVKESTITEEENLPTANIQIEDEKIPTYNLEILKIQRITSTALTEDELKAKAEQALSSTDTVYLAGAKFRLYKGTKEIGTYVTDENGKIILNDLYQYIDGKDEEAIYTLKETLSPEGYSKVQDITFKVDGTSGELKFINTEGKSESYTVENNIVKLLVEDNPSFKLIKKDAETSELLANIKFAIYNIDNDTMTPAKNSKGEIIGTKETINGREYYTVTTDDKGELIADLPEGMYKAVEVEAPDKYDLSDSTYYFGIGTSREGKIGYKAIWAKGIGGTDSDGISLVSETSDGGYIVGGYFKSSSIDLGNGVILNNKGYYDGMIIKYDANEEVEWAKGIGGTSNDYINSVSETSDGGYIVGGYFLSSSIDLGNGISLAGSKSGNSEDGMIIKYGSSGEVEWAKGIIGTYEQRITSVSETTDGSYIVGGYFGSGSIDLGNGISLVNTRTIYRDGMIIKYGSSGEAEWAQGIGGDTYDECIESVSETTDGGYIVGGWFNSQNIDLGNGVSLSIKGHYDGIIIKYNANREVEWAQGIGGTNGDKINSVSETSDGGYIVGGYFYSSSIDLGNGIILNNQSASTNYTDGMVIKYGSSGEVEWAKVIGGRDDDSITSVSETSDGGYIVGGYFKSSSIDLGNEISLNNQSASTNYTDGMVIKYGSSGEVEWAKGIGGMDSDSISSVSETTDGGYIVGGRFANNIDLGNEISLANSGNSDGMIIKIEKTELPNPTVIQANAIGESSSDYFWSVASTSDGGYIIGGSFYNSIDIGNGISLTSTGKEDGMIIKYDSEGKAEWAQKIGGGNDDSIESVSETSDGGYIVGGNFYSASIYLGDGKNLVKNSNNSEDVVIIKYNSQREVEWTKIIGGTGYERIRSVSETSDGGYIVGGSFSSRSITLENGISLTSAGGYDGMIIKYNSGGIVEWAQAVGGIDGDEIWSVSATSDGGCIVGGEFSSTSIDLGNEVSLTKKGSSDGMIIKYGSSGEVEWAQEISGTSCIESVSEASDGGYIAGGYFWSSIDLGNGVSLTNKGRSDGMIIKYSSSGEVEWARSVGKNGDDSFYSVSATSDGGYIVGGYFEYNTGLENGINLTNKGSYDGIIIKYNSEGEIEWAQGVGGTSVDRIRSVTETRNGGYVVVGEFSSDSIKLENEVNLVNKGSEDGMALKIIDKIGVPEVQELEIENIRKKYKITTDVKEIDNIKGGSISGEDKKPYETVKHGDNSTQEIKMIPDENYEIIGITVNDEDYKFIANDDGSYTMPAFTDMTEDKHIVVTYSLKDNKITINKVDKNTKEKIPGATFKLDQIEERSEPNNQEIIGELTDNGQEYLEFRSLGDEVTDKLGELTNNGTYYFVQNEDGTYTPTNSKTYQTANGSTAGISSSTANSYIPIDLTDLTGQYVVVINANCSSEGSDYGYATITTTTTAPSYSNSNGRFIYVSGTSDAKDYTSAILEGGKTYYLHLGYRKDSSVDKDDDQVVINNIKMYNANTNTVTYNFINNDGKYESTNQGKDSTVANSYIPIDLTNYTGKYNLTVNAEVSSQNYYDYGYATITENTTRPSYSSSTGRFIYIYGTQSAKDYTTVLQGGKMYYLHLGYYKNASTSSGDDKFTVNSVNITLNDSELYHTTVETNSEGQAITQIPFGKYSITETKAPDGYWINETPMIVEFRSIDDSVHEFTIEDEAKAKLTVHHYRKGTTTKLAEDEYSEAHVGDSYTTIPKLDLDKYELEIDENGKLVLPENATGTYSQTPTEVTYYYVEKKIPLTVHHYIEGTTTQVPLKDGTLAEDKVDSGLEGDTYTTLPILDEELSEEYELVETPDNANGTYSGNEVIVTYYYKKVSREVNLIKYQQDGKTPLQGAKFSIRERPEDIIVAGIKNNGTYYFENRNGKYVSNNQNKSSTTANSYMKIDMTKASEDAKVIVNAEVSSEYNYDIGYATITQAETAPAYSITTGRFVYISGTQSAKDYSTILEKGKVYYLHFGYRKDGSGNSGTDTFTINSVKINDVEYLNYTKDSYYTTNEQGKIQVDLEPGTYEVTEIEAPDGYKIPDNPTTEITITKSTTSENIEITNERKTGTVTVHHYIEGATTPVPLADGSVAQDETKTGYVGDMYVTVARTDISEGYELLEEPENASGNYIDGNIEVIYYYKAIPASVVVHHYLEGTTTKLANDVTFNGVVGDNYTTGVGNVDNKYEVVAIPTNANGKMTRETIEVIYYYRLKDASVLVHHYKEGTSESLSDDITINGKVDDEYTTTVATDIPSKYELVAEPDNKNGIMTVEQTIVTYYYRLKETGVDVHYYKEGTTEKVSEDVEITGRVDDKYTTTPATDVESKYELVETPANATGTMTEDRITVIYYYRLKDTSVLVHHYLEGTTTKLAEDDVINGQVDDTYKTVESTDLLFGKYDLVAEPENKTGTMTEDQIVVIYYYRLKNTSVLVHHYIKDTTTSLSEDVTINGQIDDEYTTTIASDIPEYYELVEEPDNKEGIMTKEQIIVTYYYQLKNYPYVVNYLEKGTDNVLHEAKQGNELVYGSTVNSVDEKIDIDGYKFDSFDKDVLTIGTTNNVINIYYTKRNDLSYKVNYLEKGTNNVIHEQKVQDGMTFDSEVTSSDEVIDIDGYNYDSVDKDTLKITTGENVINIYYTKRKDLSYKVNYLEKDTDKVLHAQKIQGGMTFGTVITSNDEVIEIDGYNYDSVDKNSIAIGTSENVINIYYTKRTDLSYKVNYLEKDTNKVLHDQKVQGNMTFESVVTSANEVIAIDGYDYDSVDKETLTISTNENVINIYYTKRNDLSYKVNYLEKTTNKVLHDQKVQDDMTFESTVTSSNEVIDIDGYNYDSVDKESLTITTSENVINIYYTKRTDLSYKVNYLEKTTNKVLHEQKTQDGMTFESVVTSSDEVIEIDGYNYDSVDKDTLTITTGENVINIYYAKRTDLSYTVNYLEKDTNKVLHNQKTQGGMTFEAEVKSADEVIDINGYKYDSADKDTLTITTGENVINIYYTKIDGLSYIVNYLEKDTNEVINPAKTVDGMTFEDVITSSDEVIDIDGYNYDSVDKDTLTIGTKENVINIYYTKRTDLSYKVNYLEKDTNKILNAQKTQNGMTFNAEIKSENEVIAIDGYDYDSVDKETLTITTGENVINIYYTKRTDLSYKVNYLEKDTNKILNAQKIQNGMTFEDVVTSADEVIDIDGYNYDSVDKDTLTITTGENVINVYYTKRTDLSYKVNYLEKTTNKILHDQKVQDGMTFESVVTSANEVIDIDGYNYDSVDKDTLTITTSENVINIYYTKRNDLSYTVNYLEKDTNIVLHEPKVTENMTFESVVNSSNEVIDIDGYNYDSVDKDTLTITTGVNVINVYYTKRNDLSYTVNYLEKDTNKVLNAPKVTENMTFGTVITSKDEVIKINGYNYDSVDKDSLTITTGTNVINVYYTKVTGLSYTVNYLDKDTDEVIHPAKTTGEQVFETEITSVDEVIDIDGYNYDSVDKDKLIIGTGENIINIYYTKRNDLSYIVNYLEKDTNKVLHEQKNQTGMTFKDTIASADEVIDIDGYDYDSVDKETLTIATSENVINIYYTKRTDLSYKVNYLEKTTNKVLHDQKVQGNMTFESTVTSANEVIAIDGYDYDSVDKETLTISTSENVINIYYTKRNDLSYKVNYLEKDTNKVLHDQKVQDGMTFESTVTSSNEVIDIDGYNYDSVDKDSLTITTGENVINIYYTKRTDLSYKVNYLEKTTNKVLHEQKVQEGMTFESVVTSSDEVIDIDGYNYDSVDKNTLTITTGENVINIYYTKRTDLSYTVNYLEKDTNKVLHNPKTQGGMTFEAEVKSADEVIDINGYKYDSVDKESIKITTGENVINIYYTKIDGLSYTVNYLEKDTNEVINPAKTVDGMTFEDVITSSDEVIDIDGYNYDSVDKETLTIGTEENIINIYYTKRTDLSYKVNYLEKDTNKILHDQKVQDGMTFESVVISANEVIEIDGYNYDSVDKETLTIETKENVINIYYTKRNDLSYTVNYLEKDTNKALHDQKIQDGMTFEDVVTSADEVIDIDGYNYNSVDKDSLTITTGENVINVYYTKRTDLSYKVNYLEKTTNKVLHNQKVQENMTFESVVTSANEVIDIDGYNYDSVDKETLTITTGENVINIYYTKRTDLSYTVNYLEKDTNIVLHEPKVTENMTFESVVTSANEVIDIDGYNYDSVDKETLTITTGANVINVYYTKRNDLSYTVNYLEKDTNKVLNTPKVTDNMTFGTVITSKDEVIKINGYNYDSVDKETLTITTGANVINVYYTKVTGLSYTVNYLDKDTDEVIHPAKTTGEQVFETEITSADEVIDIDGFNYDSVDKDTLVIGTGENIINIYYTKRDDLSYKVNYLEKDTNKVLHAQKNQTGMTFKDTITSIDEVIDIDGYDYDSVDKETLTITTSENVINIYYTKRTDLSYTVNYLEKGTNKVLHDQKVQDGMTFESVVTSANEVINIDGYDYDSVDKDSLTITTGENVINIYYTKRTDLSYKVNYLEKDTNKILHDQKVQDGMIFESTVNSSDEVIDIDGYNYNSVDKDSLIITTNENVINIYYTKRIDLSYKVNYLEKTTNKVLHDQKAQNNMTFEDVVTSSDEVIDIDGYNYDSVDKDTLTITTGENVINIYYTKRNDLSYTVNYLEKDTNKVLHNQKTQGGMTFEAEVKSADEVIDINGYKYDSADKESIKITTGENVINIYYTKIDGLSYTVNYLDKETNEVINPAKIKDGMTFEDVVTSRDEIISIDGYNFDSVDKETLTIGTEENIINIYYIKRNDLSYRVNYLEKGTNKVLHEQKVQENMTFEDVITSSDEVIDIDGYNYDSVDKETLTIGTKENVINIYYTKRIDLSYKVNYLEKDTNKVLHDQKIQDGMTFEDVITSADEVIDIDGYNYDSVDKDSLTITTGENVINVYYTKRNDLSYKVNYLEKDTNKVLHDQKVQDDMTFESVVTSANEVIDIDGYNYDSVDKDTLTIATGENVINIYYTKRNDLSYTVNYLEKDTNIVLHEPKVTENMTFESVVISANEVIDIDGYNYDSVDKETLTITTSENVINIYYTKRNDLSYTVNYLEKGTNRTIYAPKVTQNMTFGTEITSSKEVIAINGYSYDSVDKDSLIITTGANVINIYYIKVSGLSYTVNYLEKDTNEVLQAPKTTGDMTFEDEITSSDEVIDIDGYDYDSVDKDKLVIGTGENVINIYYTKRNDLSYKVNYLEKNTNKVLHNQKVQENMTFESVVNSSDEVIDIDGYNYDSVDKETLTITTNENVINIYYTKRTDLSYKVNYLEKDTNKVLHESKTTENMMFESVVNSSDEIINIYGYNYDSVDKDTLTITTGENVINIYYTKKDTKVTVHYYEEGTTNRVSDDVEITGKVFDSYETESASDIPSKYELVAEPENKTGTMTEDEITVIYYYRKKTTQVIVHYYEENTTTKLSEDVTIDGRVDDPYTTVSATDVPIKYELVAVPDNANGSMTETTIEVIYYYRVKDAVVNVRYLEKGTNIELADADKLDGKVDDLYETSAKDIEGYQLVEHTGNEKGKFEVEPITITYYYLYKTKATVQYIDKITGQILEQSTTEGLEGDEFVTESKDFENYVLVEEPAEKTVKMTKEEQVLKYYYIHVSGGVVEKHIDVISGQILANAVHEGNEGDEYDIPSRTFDGYDLVEDRLPTNAKGTMKVDPVEVIYYYIYRTKVTAEYIDKNTGNRLTADEVQNGHEGDNYITERKTFDDYKLVEVPANADGSMTKEDIKVTYYYVHTSGGVIVNHIDIKTGKQLLDETKEEGYEGDPYETHEENISGYDLVKDKYPENATGKMTIDPTRVTYYYIKKTEVNIKYVDSETGEEIDDPTNIPGHEGDDYKTEPKDVPGYDLVEEPANKNGTMTADPIDVIYYYRRPAKVIVNYYDADTKEKLTDEIQITGHQNDEYTTEQKDIKYYEIKEIPANKDGKMIVTVTKDENGNEIVEDTTYVNYYYRKLIFNLRVDKTIASVIVNGQETAINGNLGKVEVHRKELSTANVKVVYKIKVTNDSELTGKANVVENIPSGMTMKAENNPGWTINETTASIETDEIKPGESREYQVVLGWQNGDNNIGTKENVASIVTENEAGFNEKDTSDNESRADLIVAVGTGEVPYVAIAGSMLLIMISITAGVYVIKKKRQ